MAERQFRIPLGAEFNTRIAAVNINQETSGYVGLGVVGLMVVGLSAASTNKDARMVNCFPQSTGGKKYIVKRPGLDTLNTPSAGNIGNAVMVWTGEGTGQEVISSFGSTNSTVYRGTVSVGAITGVTSSVTETKVGVNVPTVTVTSSDSTAWYYDTTTAVMTKIVDVDFPGNAGRTLAGGFAHMDGFAFIMDTSSRIWASDLNSVTSWTATAFDTANAYPDKGVACVRHKNIIMAFGSESLQFYQNAGLTPFPLARIDSMTALVGAVNADAIAQISDAVFFCGTIPQGSISIYKYDGGLSRVSTPEIDSILILAGSSNIGMTAIRFYGRSFILVNYGVNTLGYCLEEDFWFNFSGQVPLWSKCTSNTSGTTMVNYSISSKTTTGKVYVMNHASLKFTDDGNSYSAQIQRPPMDFGTSKRKFYADVELICDRETVSSPITLSWSDDDYTTFSNGVTLNLADARPRTTRLGSSRRRVWALTHSAATPMRIEALEGSFTLGSF